MIVQTSWKLLMGLALIAALASSFALTSTVDAQDRPESIVLGGDTRITTAIEASRYAYPEGSSTVILAAATSPTDALVAAGLPQAPVLLVPSCGELPEVVVVEIGRLAPEQIITLGGSAAVSPDVTRQAVEGQSIPSVTCPLEGVSLEVVAGGDGGDSVTIVVRNDSDQTVITGLAYELERLEDGVWRPLDLEVAFPDIGIIIEPGSSSEPQMIGPTIQEVSSVTPLEPGRYRVSKLVAPDTSDPALAIYYAEFDIG